MNSKIIMQRIEQMSAADYETTMEIAEHFRRVAKQAAFECALHAVQLVGYELLEQKEKTGK